mmetsp:Transcript_31733/g.80158  ORF Transcript_31733/g.80158 Transcript_31733/m.80158 type:complete len:446 (-) Transcript_31733:35-1372(-)
MMCSSTDGCYSWCGCLPARAAESQGRLTKRVSANRASYTSFFFNQPVGDRAAVFAVKHGLRAIIFGERASTAIPLWIADMDLPCALEITEALQRRMTHPTFGYTYQPSEMWAAVQQWLLEEHSWQVSSDAFVFCAGVVTSAAATLWAYTSPGDCVLVMTPLYEPLQKLVEGAQRRLRKHELLLERGQYVIENDRLLQDLRGCKMLLFCNPHNPGGRAWEPSELRAVAELCHREGVMIVSDEIWSDWCIFGHRHRPMALEACEGQGVVTLMAPTKTWNLAGLHASYLVIEDQALRDQYLAAVDYAFLHYGGTFASEGMLAAYSLGKPWLQAVKRHIEDQLLHCEAFFRERCSPEVIALRPQATYLLWLDCTRLGVSDPARFFREEADVILSPGADFGGTSTAQFVRLNAATCRRSLDVALRGMAAAVAKVRAGSRLLWEPASEAQQ